MDIENLASAFIDPALPLERQNQVFLGLKSKLKEYSPNDTALHRSPFTILESSNQFFPDFQPHNISVFSLHDDLGGPDALPNDVVHVSYAVYGFHTNPAEDPLWIPDATRLSNCPTNAKLMKACSMALETAPVYSGPSTKDISDGVAGENLRTICHGTLNHVPISSKHNPALRIPSVLLQTSIKTRHPIAIGTSTLDALMAYLSVAEMPQSQGQRGAGMNLNRLQSLIVGDDDIDSQMKASDAISSEDWMPHAAEVVWKIASQEQAGETQKRIDREVGRNKRPSDEVLVMLTTINACQRALDACNREKDHLKQMVFCKWWNFLVAKTYPKEQRDSFYAILKPQTAELVRRIDTMNEKASGFSEEIKLLNKKIQESSNAIESAASSPFLARKDPSILFAGVKSGWPNGFSEPTRVRLASHLNTNPSTNGLKDIFATVEDSMASVAQHFPDFHDIIYSLLGEWSQNFQSERLGQLSWPAPMYMNSEDDFANTQGWFPLFLQWDVEYYHIPWQHWSFQSDDKGTWEYVIDPRTHLANTSCGADCRILSGRTVISPQASGVMNARIRQLFGQTNPEDLAKLIPREDHKALLEQIAKLEFFSAPLAGIGDHLLTLLRGTHPLPSKTTAVSQELGLNQRELDWISDARLATPYGSLKKLAPTYSTFSPFKPVVHGQFRFTKLHIVDKFGQIVVGVEPPQPDGTPATTLYPCSSSHVSCNPIPGTLFPNTAVKADVEEGACQFFQLPPRINQNARLNATFLSSDETLSPPRPISEWETPIWAWIVVNYLDHSLQIFNPDGAFLREVLIVPGSDRTTTTRRPSASMAPPSSSRLNGLLNQLISHDFATDLFHMLGSAIDCVGTTPAQYSDVLPGVYGKPFAVADMGMSLELGSPPLDNQSLICPLPPERRLEDYQFKIRLGSANLAYDGFVGYCHTTQVPIEQIFTPFGATDSSPRSILRESGELSLGPYFLSGDTASLAIEHNKKLQCLSVFVDPFAPLHIYSGGVLPMQELRLPRWATNNALQAMHAFFNIGPLLVPRLPPSDIVRLQSARSTAQPAQMNSVTATAPPVSTASPPLPLSGVDIPLLSQDSWKWLQPRLEVTGQTDQASETTWDTIPVKHAISELTLEQVALTEIVEGYLVMDGPMQKP